jgi:hypothetical protein
MGKNAQYGSTCSCCGKMKEPLCELPNEFFICRECAAEAVSILDEARIRAQRDRREIDLLNERS